MKIEHFADYSPKLTLEEFFSGNLKATGAFFTRSGDLSTRIILNATGIWDGKTLTLKEVLKYDSGEVHERTIYITKKNEHLYEARSNEFVGVGTISSFGNALQWSYTLKEKSKQSNEIALDFDDWMFITREGNIVNRGQAYKWGFKAGEVQLLISKE